MPRACVIVLDAVGAGELPDAADFGDEGSDTLGNVARAVGGLDLPTLEALGLGNVEPLEGCPPQPGAPAVAGRLLERSRGKDTTTGHWELMGIVTPQAMPTYPHGFPDEVIDPFMNRPGAACSATSRRAARRSSRSSARSTSGRASGSSTRAPTRSFQIAAHEETIPLEELYEACRDRRGILTRPYAVGRVIARPFVGEPGNYVRTPNRHDFSLAPRRPNRLSIGRRTPAANGLQVSERSSDIFAGKATSTDSVPQRKTTVEGIAAGARSICCATVDGGPHLLQPGRLRHAVGPPQRPRERC